MLVKVASELKDLEAQGSPTVDDDETIPSNRVVEGSVFVRLVFYKTRYRYHLFQLR